MPAMSRISALVRRALPLVVFAVLVAVGIQIIASRPEATRRSPPPPQQTVEVRPLELGDYRVIVHTQGTVEPRTESAVIAEVAGRITEVAPAFRAGGFFETGELLARIDDRDYRTSVTVARSNLSQARLALAEERARAEQAAEEWQRLELAGDPSALTLRRPQLEAARAAVASAEAQLQQAELDLERTRITAPYPCLLREQAVDVGQFVNRGTQLGLIYAVDYAEVRLPLTNRQQPFVAIPERYRRDDPTPLPDGPAVEITAQLGDRRLVWPARIVRAEGSIDSRSRQLFVVAQVDDPYARRGGDLPPLKVGQFVEAAIAGRILREVFVIPRQAVREGEIVLIANDEDRIERRRINPIWTDETVAVTRDNLAAGERLILTALAYAVDGAPITVLDPNEGPPGPRARRPETIGADADPPRDTAARHDPEGRDDA